MARLIAPSPKKIATSRGDDAMSSMTDGMKFAARDRLDELGEHREARPASSAPPGRRMPNVTVTASQMSPMNGGCRRVVDRDCSRLPSSAPPKPAMAAENANSEIFALPGVMPDVRAATSELRTASMARPVAERRRL